MLSAQELHESELQALPSRPAFHDCVFAALHNLLTEVRAESIDTRVSGEFHSRLEAVSAVATCEAIASGRSQRRPN